MDPVAAGAIVGLSLAMLNFLVSTWISSKVSFRVKLISVAWILGGFVGRLGALSLIFYTLSTIRAVHFQTALLTFAGAFTVCLAIETARFHRRARSFTPET